MSQADQAPLSKQISFWPGWYVALWVLCLFACQAPLDSTSCRQQPDCERKGLCEAKEGACLATSETDCRNSRFCFDLGLCSLDEEQGRCLALEESDCRASTQCQTGRQCIPVDGRCTEITPGYCRRRKDRDGKATPCETDGVCGFDSLNQSCVVKETSDCASSTGCKAHGRCSISEGRCAIVEDRDCRQSDLCAQFGQCYATNETLASGTTSDKVCVARSQNDCINQCPDTKIGCIFDLSLERCVLGPPFCKQSPLCRQLGLCSWEKESAQCVAGTDQDCLDSRACIDADRCTRQKGECVHSATSDQCLDDAACPQEGRCVSKEGSCVVGSDADCEVSVICEREGRCTKDDPKDICVATKTSDCAQSLECSEQGRCSLDRTQGRCVVATPIDCQSSLSCTQQKRCIFHQCSQQETMSKTYGCSREGEGLCIQEP